VNTRSHSSDGAATPGGPQEGIAGRKAKHLEVCVEPERYRVEGNATGFSEMTFVHRALPEIAESDVRTETDFLGHTIKLPLLISCMTGGSEEAYQVNKNLALAAEQLGIPVGMGSVRILFRKPDVMNHFTLKKIAPGVPVLANIGAVQVRDIDHEEIRELGRRLEVQAMVIHLNPGQELFQVDGDRNFRGVKDAIARYCEHSDIPVIVKETGFGITPPDVNFLLNAGAAYVDLAGAGGTNWITVERYREDEAADPFSQAASEFADWGIPTALLMDAVGPCQGRIIASGGIRDGMELAKALALGAHLGGMALPLVRAVVTSGTEGVIALIRRVEKVLRSVMMLTGSRTPAELQNAGLLKSARFRDEAAQLGELQ